MTITTVRSIEEVVSAVRDLRESWGLREDKEIWFRAEDAAHRDTQLQPGLYRPGKGGRRKPVSRLLEIENELYEEFRRCEAQLSDPGYRGDDDEWDSYFLMQHHGAPTRLLDWSDGSLIALHFAVRDKPVPPKSGSFLYVLDPHWLVKHLRGLPDQKDAAARWKAYWEKNKEDTYEEDWDRLYLPTDEDDSLDPLLATPEAPILWDSPHLTSVVRHK
jgi:hypothetical protein